MNAQLSSVPTTETGVACAKCSHWENRTKIVVRHASVAAVRLCQTGAKVDRVAQAIADAQAHIMRHPEIAPAGNAMELPATANAQHQTPDVPAGRYAVRGTDGEVKFYKIDKPTDGKWAGRTFVSVQASDDLHPVRNHSQRVGILAAILVDVQGARKLYGQELGVCGDCGRTLTSEWRKVGIGPVCSQK